MRHLKYIAVDFDGTCVVHKFPEIGKNIGAQYVLKYLSDNGYKIMLNTVRDEKYLLDAVDWFKNNDIKLFGINYNPDQTSWSSSPKVHADLFIDDLSLGCPLTHGFVDWDKVFDIIIEKYDIIVSDECYYEIKKNIRLDVIFALESK